MVQKLIEKFSSNQNIIDEILNEIKGQIKALIIDKNGNHVVQKFFDLVHYPRLQFIIDYSIKEARYTTTTRSQLTPTQGSWSLTHMGAG